MIEDLTHEAGASVSAPACDYALGVLDRAPRLAAEARMAVDPAYAQEVLDWTVRLAPLLDGVGDREPPADLWARLEAQIVKPAPAPAPITTVAEAAGDPAEAQPRARLWSRIGLWRAWAVVATVTAVLCAFGLAISGHKAGGRRGLMALVPGRGEALSAALQLNGVGAPLMTLTYDPTRRALFVSPDSTFSVPLHRQANLWLATKNARPHRIGAIDPNHPGRVDVPSDVARTIKGGMTVALSIEAEAGGKGAGPTSPRGPVIAAGSLLTF